MGGLCRYYGILIGFGIATAMDFAFVILGKSWLPLSPVYSCYCFDCTLQSKLVLDPIEALRYE
jgi:hypothetical protein